MSHKYHHHQVERFLTATTTNNNNNINNPNNHRVGVGLGLGLGVGLGSRSRRWKHVKTSTVLVITTLLAFTTCAWISLVFSSRHYTCRHQKKQQSITTTASSSSSSSSFPWEPLEGEYSNTNMTGGSSSSNSHDIGSKWHGFISSSSSSNKTEDLRMSQIMFGIAGAAQLWPRRKEYVKLWWRPGEMRGFVWLEKSIKEEEDNRSSSDESLLPEVKVSEDTSNFTYTNPTGHPSGIRIARIVQEAFRLKLPDVHWFVMGDDDTVFAADNLLRVLGKYDPKELYYIGNPSESHSSNTYFSHGMAFGGGGIAISYELAKALSGMLDDCLERYPFLFGSDDRLHACISELGVPLTKEPGFHQFDVHGNAFGLLVGHPIAPFISMHHLEEMDPFFPQYSAMEGLQHLTKAMKTEPSSFLQRCICYDRKKRLTFSISLGYVVQVYPYVLLPRELERREITFKAWNKKNGGGEFDFDTRATSRSVCNKPILFFMDEIYHDGIDMVSIYKRDVRRDSRRRWSFCFSYASHRDDMKHIRVVSKPMKERWFKAPRRQCCKVVALQDQSSSISIDSC